MECNNFVVFFGIGLGCIFFCVFVFINKMLVLVVCVVVFEVLVMKDLRGVLLLDVDVVRDVSVRVVREVIKMVVEEVVVCEEGILEGEEDLESWIWG